MTERWDALLDGEGCPAQRTADIVEVMNSESAYWLLQAEESFSVHKINRHNRSFIVHNNVERQWQRNQARRVSRQWRKEREMRILSPIPVPMEDALVHTAEHPFCSDDSCPCHTDSDLVNAQVNEPYSDGLLTAHEANRLRMGEQL